jgi:hypothetical protein
MAMAGGRILGALLRQKLQRKLELSKTLDLNAKGP